MTIVVVIVSEIVGSIRCAKRCVTGWLEKIDVPKSPLSRLRIQTANCSYSGRSRPSFARMAAVCCGVAWSPAISAAGSPGLRWRMAKTMTATIASTGTVARTRRPT